MLHTITADFYRLFRSKGFWITELILLINSLASIIFGVIGSIGVHTDTSVLDKLGSNGGWTGFQTVENMSSNFSLVIMFTIILANILIGIEISQKLYKNALSYGISRTHYILSKSVVLMALVIFQLILAYASSFLIACLINGIGSMPSHFFSRFLTTFILQFFCTCAWVSLVALVLYASHSIVAAIFSYFVGTTLVSLLTIYNPDVEFFLYLNMQFNLSMADQQNMVLQTLLVALGVIAMTFGTSLVIFNKQNL